MANELEVKKPLLPADVERVVVGGDLGPLTPLQRVQYHNAVCESVGLNPLTRPFDYLVLNGKTVLYARKDATDQLRTIHNVSVHDVTREVMPGDLLVVTAKGRNARGREDAATGAVSIAGLRGDNLANAYMKAETKAKRRLTLSLCGLGILDESEIETIPHAAKASVQPPVTDGDAAMTDAMYRVPPGLGDLSGTLLSEVMRAPLIEAVEFIDTRVKMSGKPMAKRYAEFIERATVRINELEDVQFDEIAAENAPAPEPEVMPKEDPKPVAEAKKFITANGQVKPKWAPGPDAQEPFL